MNCMLKFAIHFLSFVRIIFSICLSAVNNCRWSSSPQRENSLVISLHLPLVLFFLVLCSRPTALQDRTRDSDEDDLHDRDYDVAALANNLSQAFRYKIYGNEDNEEVHQWLLFLMAFIPFFLLFLNLSFILPDLWSQLVSLTKTGRSRISISSSRI